MTLKLETLTDVARVVHMSDHHCPDTHKCYADFQDVTLKSLQLIHIPCYWDKAYYWVGMNVGALRTQGIDYMLAAARACTDS